MNQFELNKSYPIKRIDAVAMSLELDIEEYGPELMGANFIVILCGVTGNVCSFVLDGIANDQGYYKCIYNDWL